MQITNNPKYTIVPNPVQPYDQQLVDLAALDYTGNGKKLIAVNSAETALELVNPVPSPFLLMGA